MKKYCLIILVWLAGHPTYCQQLTVTTAFESGSARVLGIDTSTQTVRIIPSGDPQRGMPNWWYLRIDGIRPGKPFFLEVSSTSDPIPAGPPGTFRRMSPDWTWPAQATWSIDGKTWQHSEAGKRTGDCMRYKLETGSPVLWLAWGPPFTPEDVNTLSQQLTGKFPFIGSFPLAISKEGRTVTAFRVSEGGTPVAQRPAIWVQARQHAWEAGGSWVAVGMIRWLVSDDTLAVWLRRNTEMFIIPLMDVDHVSTGDGGKHALPHDHNRDWTSNPHWPEIAASQKFILKLAEEGRMNIFLDLHNPAPGNKEQTMYVLDSSYMSNAAFRRQEKFVELMKAAFGVIKLNRNGPKPAVETWEERVSEAWVLAHSNEHTIGFCIETPWNSHKSTIEGYRAVGESLGKVIGKMITPPFFAPL